MAATTVITKLVDSKRRQIVSVEIVSDGEELTDSVVYDYSMDTQLPEKNAAGNIKINGVWFENPTAAGQIFVEFDGATDSLAVGCGVADSHHTDYNCIGGINNSATTPTGDITVTTLGFANGESARVTLDILK